MSLDYQIQKALKQQRDRNATVFTATVTAVNEASKTITVKDIDGLEFFDVRLAAAEDAVKSLLIIPKVNSSVLVAMIGNDLNTLFVAKVNAVEKVVGEIENVSFEVDAAGYKIAKGDQDLKTVLNDYIDEVNKIIVIKGRSINVAATTAIKARLNQILK